MTDLVNLPWTKVATHPYHEEPAVKKYWSDGKHPLQCKGECMITDAGGMHCCWPCGWDDMQAAIINTPTNQ